jgi:hypothetical protein
MRRALATCFVLALLGCGGTPKPGPDAPHTNDVPTGPGGTKGGDGADRSQAPPRDPCADGSCVACGDGVCPTGFYCEKAKGRAGCAWAASCAEKPTCGCLVPHVKGCSCEDKGGVPFVTCGAP